jgi:hypothetical protein
MIGENYLSNVKIERTSLSSFNWAGRILRIYFLKFQKKLKNLNPFPAEIN